MKQESVTSQVGPKLTDYNGELDTPVLVCTGCTHLCWHDRHYPYCKAQPDTSNRMTPPAGFGTYLRQGAKPTKECPFPLKEKEQDVQDQ